VMDIAADLCMARIIAPGLACSVFGLDHLSNLISGYDTVQPLIF